MFSRPKECPSLSSIQSSICQSLFAESHRIISKPLQNFIMKCQPKCLLFARTTFLQVHVYSLQLQSTHYCKFDIRYMKHIHCSLLLVANSNSSNTSSQSVRQSVSQSVSLSVSLSICLSVRSYVCLSQSVCQSFSQAVCLSVFVSVCTCVFL